jgi:5-methylcytosine-specific restriction endonuclease McrA
MPAPAEYVRRAVIAPELLERLRHYGELVWRGRYASVPQAAKAVMAATRERQQLGQAEANRKWLSRRKTWEARAMYRLRPMILTRPCTYCGDPDPVTLDHIVPKSQGGRTILRNLAPACRPCNSQKNNRTPGQWKTARLARGLPWPPAWPAPAASVA